MNDHQLEERVSAKGEIERLARERGELMIRLAENRQAMRQALRDGRRLKWGVTNLSAFSGLTRRAIYDVLGDE